MLHAYCTICWTQIEFCPGHVYGPAEEQVTGYCYTCNRRPATHGGTGNRTCDACEAEWVQGHAKAKSQ